MLCYGGRRPTPPGGVVTAPTGDRRGEERDTDRAVPALFARAQASRKIEQRAQTYLLRQWGRRREPLDLGRPEQPKPLRGWKGWTTRNLPSARPGGVVERVH